MKKPLVDIFVPTYQPDPGFLRKALDSILYQTEQCWRCSINDDASHINVRDIVDPYLKDPRFSFHRNPRRLGIGGNWNACLGVALRAKLGTPFIQYLFQDDYWYANYLRQVLAVFETYPDTGFVSADHEYQCEPGIQTAKGYEELRTFKNDALAPGPHEGGEMLRWWISRDLHPNVIGEPSFVMLRRDIVQTVGEFANDMPQFLDVDYWVRAMQQTNWYNLSEELGVFRVHAHGASAKNYESGEGVFDRFRCMERLVATLPKGPQRQQVVVMRRRALKHMVWQALDRMIHRQTISVKGSGAFQRFCLKHPILVGKATSQVLWEKLKKELTQTPSRDR